MFSGNQGGTDAIRKKAEENALKEALAKQAASVGSNVINPASNALTDAANLVVAAAAQNKDKNLFERIVEADKELGIDITDKLAKIAGYSASENKEQPKPKGPTKP